MGLKDEFNELAKTVTDAVDGAVQSVKHDVEVAASKVAHGSEARAEEARRADAGDALSALDVTKSVAHEVRERTLAQVDFIRQTIRKHI